MGRHCFSLLINLNIPLESFFVSELTDDMQNIFYGISIQSVEAVELDGTCGIIIAVRKDLFREIKNRLLLKGILADNIFIFEG